MANPKGLNPAAHLSPDVFDLKKLKQVPTRDGYGEGVVAAGEKDPNVIVLCADLTESTRSLWFKRKFPERFVQFGVSEQSLAAVGAGLALAGKIPFISSYAMFCPGRAWEQVRTNIALNGANVKIAGAHAGVSVGPDGATHQAIEDIAIMRCIPGMTVVVPCDSIETKKCTVALAKADGPAYFRFAREKSPVFTTSKTPFAVGRAVTYRFGKHVAIFGAGPVLHNALLAAHELSKEGIECLVVNNATVKPMDARAVAAAAKLCGAVVTVEEHQRQGGMGSRVAEILAGAAPTPIEFVGVDDRFGETGEPNELIEKFGMGVKGIKQAVKRVLKRKH
jgi:transketolase